MVRKFTTAIEYAQFYSRVEAQFSPEELERDVLTEWLQNESLADLFSLTREVAIQIEEADTIAKLKELQKETMQLTIHRIKLLNRIDEKVGQIIIIQRELEIAKSFVGKINPVEHNLQVRVHSAFEFCFNVFTKLFHLF